ncbi:MAG: RNA polymerase sigma factor RpoD/SigA [Ruminococcaceae bacterium]|nr:RNA polymerase sigma factor RpoD/SigA [Oscillospiraceae bacterium]
MTSDVSVAESPIPVSTGEEDVRQYLHEIRQYPRLSPEQERLLAKRCAEGDADAIRQMVNSNLRLVVSVAKEYAGRGVPLMDLIQEGSIGLLAAAKKFDYTLEFRFSTYATKWIRQGITRCLADHGLIRVPAHTAERIRKVNAARETLLKKNGEEPTVEQLSAYCNIPEQKVRQLLQLDPQLISIDAPVGSEEEGTLAELLEDIQSPQPYEELIREELNHTMDTLLSMLTDRQQQVLRLHFGMADGVCHSLDEIGKLLEISKERARQIEQQAMEKLQKLGASMGLEEFLV